MSKENPRGLRKLLKEFKEFISKGSVLDLAVGVIIGSAFTAIVNALVNYILKPLINWIPLSDKTGGLQTLLRPAVLDDAGNIVTEALVLDWGAVISAIITFLLTAIVLFAVIKAINVARNASEKAKENLKKLAEKDKAEEKPEEVAEETPAEVPVVETPAVETPAVEEKNEIAELLKDIKELLQAQAANKDDKAE